MKKVISDDYFGDDISSSYFGEQPRKSGFHKHKNIILRKKFIDDFDEFDDRDHDSYKRAPQKGVIREELRRVQRML